MADRINQDYSLGGFGERLKAAREALNLSQKDAALRLHLNPEILQILETENFEKAPPVTFLRGYLRSYARLLNFKDDDINAALTQSAFESQTSPLVTPVLPRPTMQQMGDRYVQWISTAVVLGLFVFVGVWWGLHSSASNTANTLARTPAPQPAAIPAAAPPAPPIQSVSTHSPTPPPVAEIPAAGTQPAPNNLATTQQPAAPTTTTLPPSNPANPPVAATALPAGIPSAPLMTPIDPALQPTVAEDDSPKKRRHHRQDNNVSGFAMALPEPGL